MIWWVLVVLVLISVVQSNNYYSRLGMKHFVLHSRRLRVHADAKSCAFMIIRSHDRFAGSSPSSGAFHQDARLLRTNLVEMGHTLPAANIYACEKGSNDELQSPNMDKNVTYLTATRHVPQMPSPPQLFVKWG